MEFYLLKFLVFTLTALGEIFYMIIAIIKFTGEKLMFNDIFFIFRLR